MTVLHIEGWVSYDDNGIVAVKEYKEHSSWNARAIPKEVEDFAEGNGWIRRVEDGLGGKKSYIENASLRIYFTEEKATLSEAQESLVYETFGDVETDIRLTGYSEYTITGYSLKDFSIGGHDLEREIEYHDGEYMHFILEC